MRQFFVAVCCSSFALSSTFGSDTGCAGDGANSSVVADYLLNEGSGSTAYNTGTGGSSGDLTLTNGPAFSSDVPSVNASCGSSVVFTNNAAGTAALESSSGYDPLAGATQFTIMAWVKRESLAAASNTNARIISDIDSLNATANGVEFRFLGSAGTLNVNLNGTLRGTTSGGIAPNSNSWLHVAVVYDGSRPATNQLTRHFHFYVNAVQQGVGVSNNALNVTVGANSNPLTIGNSAVSRAAGNQFVGKLDDLRILRGFAPDAVGSGNTNSIIQCYMNRKDDFTSPSISCPADKNVNADTGQCSATGVSLGNATATDNCSGTITISSNAPASYPVGVTYVVWTATDAPGNAKSCTQTVTVADNQAPTITCPADITVNADSGQCSKTNIDIGTPVTSDNCAVTSVTHDAPSVFPVATTTITRIAYDAAGNTSTCQQHVVVLDNQLPSIACPATVTAYTDTGACSASGVSLGSPVISDNCSGATATNNAPAAIPLGTNTATWTVTDTSGNSNTCQQTVIILDNKLPSITCPADVTVNADAGTNIATNVNLGTPVTSDNCSVASISSNAPVSFPLGNTTVTWTVLDGSGNSNTCQQTVTVLNGVNNSNVVITELATGYANSYQWFEIYNRGTGTVDVANWKIQVGSNNYTFNLYQGSTVLSGSTYAVVARVATNFLNSYPSFTGTLLTAAYPTLSNTGRQVTLRDASLTTIESFSYITNLTGTLERRNYDWMEYSSTNWDKSAATDGTPNRQNTRKFVRVYFNFPPPQNGSSETNIDLAFVNLINSATGTAWCALYQVNRQVVVSSLCDAKTNRNVDVRITTDTDYFSDPGYTNFYAQMQSAGITVKGDGRSSLHHVKFAVVDGRYVWSGSWNATDSGTTDDVQNGIIVDSASLAQAYEREFNQYWSNKFGTAKTKGGTNDHVVAGTTVKVFFAPKDGCVSNIVNVTKSATANNYFEIYTFSTNAISNAIITNKNNGLVVHGYMDNLSAGQSSSMYKPLTNAFVDVKKDNYSGLLHHKVFIVDAASTNNAQIVTGSFNWTASAETANDENVLIIYSYDLANIFYQEFLTNYNH